MYILSPNLRKAIVRNSCSAGQDKGQPDSGIEPAANSAAAAPPLAASPSARQGLAQQVSEFFQTDMAWDIPEEGALCSAGFPHAVTTHDAHLVQLGTMEKILQIISDVVEMHHSQGQPPTQEQIEALLIEFIHNHGHA